MRKLFLSLFTAIVLLAVSCSEPYDDSPPSAPNDNLENNDAQLKELCQQINTNILALQTIVEVLQNDDYVTNIAPITKGSKIIGYTISFSMCDSITIYCDEDGKDGYTPQIGVKADANGLYYWTLDGEWLLDNSGNQIKVYDGVYDSKGRVPKLKIEDGNWYLSYSSGTTWTKVGKVSDSNGDPMFELISFDDNFVYIILADGTNLMLSYNQADSSVMEIKAMIDAIPVAMVLPYSVFGSSSNQGFDFGFPGIMCAIDGATGDVVVTSGDANSGYNWFWFWEVGTSLNSNQTRSQFTWNFYWDIINSCNDIISIVSEPQTYPMKAYLAYAKANRAALYLDMARSFDPLENNYTDVSTVKGLTVPKIIETTTEEEACNNPRLSREDMFAFIFRDLTDAETLLMNNPYAGDKTVPTLGVVYGLMARAYLWLGGFDSSNYAQAATYARKAIDVSGATIMNKAQWLNPKTGFNTPNNSWLWYLPQSFEGISNLANFVAWRSCEAAWGYGSLVQQGTHVNFYNRIPDSDWRKSSFIGPDPDAWYEANAAISNYSAGTHGDKFSDYFSPYASVKFRPMNGEILDYKYGNATSVCMMRVEEMILIEIEALAYTDPATAAAKLKEFVLTRNPSYAFAGTSTEEVVAEAIWQKRVELWGEGIVFYDLKRLNYSIETGYPGTNVATDSRMKTEGRAPWWNFAIPETAALQNPILQTTNNPDPCDLIKPWTNM